MKVSFVMPCYNGAAYLSEAVKSVLNQEYPDIELIVVNDGSTDSSYKVLQYFEEGIGQGRMKVITQENKGAAAALNVGMESSTGDIILVADADDIQEPGRAQIYVDSMPEVDFAYSSYYHASIHGKIHSLIRAKPMTVEGIKANDSVPGASIAIKRSVYDKGLRYREHLRVNYDMGLIVDLYKMHLKYALIDIPTFRYRVLNTGMSYSKKKIVESITEELSNEL